MERDALPSLSSSSVPSRPRQKRQVLQREQASRRAPTAQSATTAQDARNRPHALATWGHGEKRFISGATNTGAVCTADSESFPAAAPKPLFFTTARRLHEGTTPDMGRARLVSPEGKSITPDGGSAGREGRQFTVANVGNNGRIYLRPTVRPANQRYPQPNFTFPNTSSSPAGRGPHKLGPETKKKSGDSATVRPHESTLSLDWSTQTPTRPVSVVGKMPSHLNRPRALSDSTRSTRPASSIARETDPGGFKIVITQPGGIRRSKTVEDLDGRQTALLLDINIPSWKIGTPRFSVRGTPFIRGSSYAPTDEYRSSGASHPNRNPRHRVPGVGPNRKPVSTRRAQQASEQCLSPASLFSSGLPTPPHATDWTHQNVDPSMFDALTFKPDCDDHAVVRYSSTGAVTAATPSRLVAEITSLSFLDYELLSDFFLTFRSFLASSELLRMLVGRLRWALEREDEVGLVVRVRTFVALRHWVLNYFMDDFVVDYDLRVLFCTQLNDLVDELSLDPMGRKGHVKILAELKKCWRRACGQYWDGPNFDASLGPEVPITPGGIAGHRDPNLDPTFWNTSDAGPPHLDTLLVPSTHVLQSSFYADVSRAGHIDTVMMGDPDRPDTPIYEIMTRRHVESSIASFDVTSCSLLPKNLRQMQAGTGQKLASHPVDPSSVDVNPDPVAMTPRALTGKRVRAPHNLQRNPSLAESLNERETTTEKAVFKTTEFFLTLPHAGSLVRGNLFPPGQAFVELLSPRGSATTSRQTTIFQPRPTHLAKERIGGSAMSGQGMRRLLVGVRRALSNRGQAFLPNQANIFNISPLGPRGATTNRLPGTAIVPQARPNHHNRLRPAVRIDLLGAEAAEDFQNAVREHAAAEAEKNGYQAILAAGPRFSGDLLNYSAAHMDSGFHAAYFDDMRPKSEDESSTGSKSILIGDGTWPMPTAAVAGALPMAFNASVETFEKSYGASPADPTPPNTPPGLSVGTPRRSSFIISKHMLRHALSADGPPSTSGFQSTLVSDLQSHVSTQWARLARGINPSHRPSHEAITQGPRILPLRTLGRHRRQGSSKSYGPHASLGHRRGNLHSGGVTRTASVPSFDATTYSEASEEDEPDQTPEAQPRRPLRRRPGGDLRAVNYVGQLNHAGLRKSRSAGSLTTLSDSAQSSYLQSPVQRAGASVAVADSECSPHQPDTFSLSVITKKKKSKSGHLSLLRTHSSKPIMRPSFELEAQKLAQIPDDINDDGGVESALLKLEGKFQTRRPISMGVPAADSVGLTAPEAGSITTTTENVGVPKEGRIGHRHALGDVHPAALSQTLRANLAVDVGSLLLEDSRASYGSLLDRDFSQEQKKGTPPSVWVDRSVLQDAGEHGIPPYGQDERDSTRASHEFLPKTESMEEQEGGPRYLGQGPDSRHPNDTGQSFLCTESEDENDLSSELSAEVFFPFDGEDLITPSMQENASLQRPIHSPNEDPSGVRDGLQLNPQPPSPPVTAIPAAHLLPAWSASLLGPTDQRVDSAKPLPPTPVDTPTMAAAPYCEQSGPLLSPADPTGTREALRDAPKLNMANPVASDSDQNKFSVHLPFVLAFRSDVLAQQLTLIEKDALNEIDWKELIEMRWKNADKNGIDSRSWVSFLRDTDARGVEVVIARFNLIVKWAVSEIVLTQDVEERARTIIKFIHLAAHCRRLRNFATTAQVTIALTSNEIGRLTKTWAMVPASDVQTLLELETLISPTRNFWNLRAEMEGGGTLGAASADMGCIPFVGIYTHDLLFNAQRPSEIASSPTGTPLVNFERCRIAASIVKTLLRLVEASVLYDFQPVEGITERCLWIGALSDAEIRRHSEALE